MRNGYGEIDNCLASLLIYVKKEIKTKESKVVYRSTSSDLEDMMKNHKKLAKIIKEAKDQKAIAEIEEQMLNYEKEIGDMMSKKKLSGSSASISSIGITVGEI